MKEKQEDKQAQEAADYSADTHYNLPDTLLYNARR